MSTETTPTLAPSSADVKRKRQLLLLATGCLVATAAYSAYWLLVARYKVDTDNAYVQGNIVQITPQIGGTVVAVEADDTDMVRAGQRLIRLDPADARIALDQAEAQLAETVREVRSLFVANAALAAGVDSRKSELTRTQAEVARLADDLARRKPLVDSGAVSREEVLHLQTAVDNAKSAENIAAAKLAEAREQLAQNQSLTENTTPETHPRVLAAAAKVRDAWLANQRLGIVAPIAGMVAKRNVQVGQRVAGGTPLMAVVPLDQLWVDANFKESQLEDLRLGQPVELTADSYGQRLKYRGSVAGLAAGTGSAFSLLPAQNATGNWIKIVQRVPVRIQLDPAQLAEHPLRVGLSMNVTVDVRDQSGRSVAEAGKSAPAATTQVFDDLDKAADARVNKIVSEHLGHAVKLRRAG